MNPSIVAMTEGPARPGCTVASRTCCTAGLRKPLLECQPSGDGQRLLLNALIPGRCWTTGPSIAQCRNLCHPAATSHSMMLGSQSIGTITWEVKRGCNGSESLAPQTNQRAGAASKRL